MSGITTNDAKVTNDATDAKATDGANTSPLTIDDISVESYRNADVSGKAAMRRMVEMTIKSEMAHDVADIDVVRVKALFALDAALKPIKAEKSEKDYRALIVRRVAVLTLASEMLRDGTVRPDGTPDETDMSDMEAEIVAMLDNRDEDLIADATDIAARKVAKSGNQYNVGDVIANAFKDAKSGTFYTIRQICAMSDYAHDGAVAARLFPKSGDVTVSPDIIPVPRNGAIARGARKA